MITAVFCAAAVLVSVLDAAEGAAPSRRLAAAVVPDGGSVEFITAVATSLLTVTSITFSVLLLAVQQTASSLTAVVFDQFLRRRANQAYFGFFVGASAFTFIILGLAREEPAPVHGAALTLLLAITALVVLLLLIHSSIDQMRPESVVRSIHELALRARERELVLLGRTRMKRTTPEGTPERRVCVLDSGYVVTVHVDKLADIAASAGNGVEVLVEGQLGKYLVFGDVVARLVGVDPDDDSRDEEVLAAFGMDDFRDVTIESGYAIDQLENIAWETATSAAQSPQTAAVAVRALSDLLGRWLIAGERDRSDRAEQPEELPVVYLDGAVEQGIRALATLVVGSAESRQAKTCAEIIRAFARIAPRLREEDKAVFEEVLDSALPALIQHAELPVLRDSLRDLEEVLEQAGHDVARLAETRGLLAEASRRLMPKPSDEPEAVHPD
ncbi:DUF2254 domain-containing protein [Arthrobacter sp. E918]|uniref:DUF2254 domain-containing protein n=1 Tax=Arthrobacter mobilis TaxID=2724944 RepID=A0A7X6HBS0_9MICC|nr:DUF2254 domain-containing protein [Arthrobacter mobilis]